MFDKLTTTVVSFNETNKFDVKMLIKFDHLIKSVTMKLYEFVLADDDFVKN